MPRKKKHPEYEIVLDGNNWAYPENYTMTTPEGHFTFKRKEDSQSKTISVLGKDGL